ncbi:MAG: protein-glutamate O-methyltransferase [Pseudomonadales bacterium]
MIAVKKNQRAPEHTLTDKEFRFICQLVYDSTGIVLDDRKREMVYRRLMRRTRELRIPSFKDYCLLLKNEDNQELPNFINAITTNLTGFFRESHHFDFLKDQFIPAHLAKYAATKRLRVWSAACSTGEEPYSLAITLKQAMDSFLNQGKLNQGKVSQWDVKILATDLDSTVLETAKVGTYSQDNIKDLSKEIKHKWFKKGSGDNSDKVKVNPQLKGLITFKQLNLMGSWPVQGPFDVIMCRNVLIYFDRNTQHELVDRFYQLLRPGGLLMLGHSESLMKEESAFEVKGRTIFQKPIHRCQQTY